MKTLLAIILLPSRLLRNLFWDIWRPHELRPEEEAIYEQLVRDWKDRSKA